MTRCPHCGSGITEEVFQQKEPFCGACGGELRKPASGKKGSLFGKKRKGRGSRGRKGARFGLERGFPRRTGLRTLGGLAFTAVGFLVLLYFRLVVPVTARLSIDFEVKAPQDVSVEADYSSSLRLGGRQRRQGWRVDLRARVKNTGDRALRLGEFTAELRDHDGGRLYFGDTRGELTAGGGGADAFFLLPGESCSYQTLVPLFVRAGGGENRLKCVLRMKEPTSFDPGLLGRVKR